MSKSKLVGHEPGTVAPGKTKGLIFGPAGVGKTWFTLSFPRPYYFDSEGGADLAHYQERLKAAGGRYLGPADGTLEFDFVINQIQALATEEHPYKTVIIDSVTKLWSTCILNEQERLKDKDAFGASKKPAIHQMRRLVNWCTKLDMNVWLVAHESAEWGLVNGQRQEIGRSADCWDKLNYELDIVLQAQKRGASRVAVVKKSRLTGFPESDAFDLDYAVFADRYGKDFIEASVQPISLATAEQVTEIKRLIEVVKVSEAEIEKILSRASAESWEELNEQQAQTTIQWLTKKVSGKGVK